MLADGNQTFSKRLSPLSPAKYAGNIYPNIAVAFSGTTLGDDRDRRYPRNPAPRAVAGPAGGSAFAGGNGFASRHTSIRGLRRDVRTRRSRAKVSMDCAAIGRRADSSRLARFRKGYRGRPQQSTDRPGRGAIGDSELGIDRRCRGEERIGVTGGYGSVVGLGLLRAARAQDRNTTRHGGLTPVPRSASSVRAAPDKGLGAMLK